MTKDKEKLPRLIKWAKDGYPPIDLANEFRAVIALIKAYKEQQKHVDRLTALVEKADEVIDRYVNYHGDSFGLKRKEALESYTTARKEIKTTD